MVKIYEEGFWLLLKVKTSPRGERLEWIQDTETAKKAQIKTLAEVLSSDPLEMARPLKVFEVLSGGDKPITVPKGLFEKCRVNGYGRHQLCRVNLGSTERRG